MQIKIDNGSSPDIDESVLLCPTCDSSYLHQKRVEIFSRGEDQEKVLRTTVNCISQHTVTEVVENRKSGNPSQRRDGIRILFECEECNYNPPRPYFYLNVSQHKGYTFLSWETKGGSK